MKFKVLGCIFLFAHSECLAQSTFSATDSLSVTSSIDTPTPQPTAEFPAIPSPWASPSPTPSNPFPNPIPSPEDESRCGDRPNSQGMGFLQSITRFTLAHGPHPFQEPEKEWIANDSGGQWVYSLNLLRSIPDDSNDGGNVPLPPGDCNNVAPAGLGGNSGPGSESYMFSLTELWKCQADNTWFLEKIQWIGNSDIQKREMTGGVLFSGLFTFIPGVACPQVSAYGSGKFQTSYDWGTDQEEANYFLSSTTYSEGSRKETYASTKDGVTDSTLGRDTLIQIGTCFNGPAEVRLQEYQEHHRYSEKQKLGNRLSLSVNTEKSSFEYNPAGAPVAGGSEQGRNDANWDENGNPTRSYFDGSRELVVGVNQIATIANVELTKYYYPALQKLKQLDFRSSGNFGSFSWDSNGLLQTPSDPTGAAALEQKKLDYQQARQDALNASLPNSIDWPSGITNQQ